MKLSLYNTLTRQEEIFEPLMPGRVTMYVCGPTVYNYPHIGNARPAVVFDLLYRLLSHLYDEVIYARNITDVDDKINEEAKRRGVSIEQLTNETTASYHEDMRQLRVLDPVREPKATEHISNIIRLVEKLLQEGYAYEAEGHVLFNVAAYGEYGKLSGRSRDEQIAGARVEVAPYKKDATDFVLWKPAAADEPGWDSPWGRGRPGWHIECSAMIETHLGETIDIHGGGQDLIFPHHENELAQGTCAHSGKPYCRYWVHNGFVRVAEEKMSKSIGNVVLVRDLLQEAPGEVVRLALLSSHYRAPLEWNDDTLPQAWRRLDTLYRTLENLADVEVSASNLDLPEAFLTALCDDLNISKALAELHETARAANKTEGPEGKASYKRTLLSMGNLLGLLQENPSSWFARGAVESQVDEQTIQNKIAQREQARKDKDFATADRIRDELKEQGILLEDTSEGTKWRKAKSTA